MKIEWLLIGGPAHLSIAWNLCDLQTMTFVDGQTYYEYRGYKVYSGYHNSFYMVGVQEFKELEKHDVLYLIQQANLTPI
jgi:hypothetical protein